MGKCCTGKLLPFPPVLTWFRWSQVLDDQRAMNLVLNTGYVKWGKPLMEDGDAIDGLTRTGLKVTLLPNLQVTREVVTDGGGGGGGC